MVQRYVDSKAGVTREDLEAHREMVRALAGGRPISTDTYATQFATRLGNIAKGEEFIGSGGRIRTYNKSVNSRLLCH